jgi:hypothetical protein
VAIDVAVDRAALVGNCLTSCCCCCCCCCCERTDVAAVVLGHEQEIHLLLLLLTGDSLPVMSISDFQMISAEVTTSPAMKEVSNKSVSHRRRALCVLQAA